MVDSPMYIGSAGVADIKLYWGSAGYMRAANDTQLDIIGSGTGQYAIALQPAEGGSVYVSGYLGLKVTDTDGDSEGELWYDSTSKKLHFWDGTQEREVNSS